MTQVLTGRAQGESARRIYLEVLRTDGEAILASLDSDCSITLLSHPLTWFEIGEHYRGGKREFHYDQEFRPLMKGEREYPADEAARKLIRGCYAPPAGFKNGALDALVDALPSGDIHLFTQEGGFVGRFANKGDAQMIAKALGSRPVLLGSADEVKELPAVDLGLVLSALDPERKWPAKLKRNHYLEVFEMAKKKVKSKAKKVVKAETKQKRADGPVAKARELFASMKDKSTQEILAAAEAAGINKNTAQTQLGKWRKENGIVVKRGGTRKPATPAKAKAKKAKKKAATKPREPAVPKHTGTEVKAPEQPKADEGATSTEPEPIK